MTNYQNIATIVIRAVAIMCIVLGYAICLQDWMRTSNHSNFWQRFMPYLIVGLGSFILSKLFAILVCFGLKKSND